MKFEPIAIVGRGCVFPEALNPSALWDLVAGNRDAISACPDGRWRIARERVIGDGPERAWTDRGGYVTGFNSVFDPSGFAIPPGAIQSHDDTVRWMLHTAREALREAGIDGPDGVPKRTGAVVGLLGLPSENMAQYAEQIWSGAGNPAIAPANRFLSGLPPHLLAQALRLDLGAFSLDAACASSLYAIKLACDALHDGRADLMLAGGVNRADDLFLHIGFSTLKAISRSGMSRPFHAGADGLLPAEGAGFVTLKRLADAEAAGNRILAVIRGIGVSNDGRTAGLLTPSEEGQEQAMRQAYSIAGLDPSTISLIECHATGTPVGDACEIRSTGRLFRGLHHVPIASVKSNLGHPITAAGIAGLLKLIGAIEHRLRPASLHVPRAADSIGALSASPFRLLLQNEPWDAPVTLRAALSGFGFGGNNAHLILEEYGGPGHRAPQASSPRAKVAVVSVGVSAGDAIGTGEFTRAVFRGEPREHRMETISLAFDRLGFPPLDLASALPQQVLALQAASEALDRVGVSAASRTGVFVGMGCDAEVARYGFRWRTLAGQEIAPVEADGICPALTAPAVIGRLANIVANRISSKYDLRGPSFAVMAEELSGITALRLAARALAAGELDAAVVGAVDLSFEPIHEAAGRAALPSERQVPGDAAVFFILKRRQDAGVEALAVIAEAQAGSSLDGAAASRIFGHAHAASGLLDRAVAVLACARGALVPARPWIALAGRRAGVRVSALGGASGEVTVSALPNRRTRALVPGPAPRIFLYSGEDRRALLETLRSGRHSQAGPAKLAIVAAGEREFAENRERARQALETGAGAVSIESVYFRERPVEGELALVFPGAASAYREMGRSFLLAFPELLDSLSESCPKLTSAAAWIFDPHATGEPSATQKLWASSLLSQAHSRFTLRTLGLQPDAAIGVSSGETNSLAAFGVWRDLDVFFEEFNGAGVLDRVLGGAFEITGGLRWEAWQIAASRLELDDLLSESPGLRLTGTYAPDEYSIAGEASACARAFGRVRTQRTGPRPAVPQTSAELEPLPTPSGSVVRDVLKRAQRLNYDLVVHCDAFAPYAEKWRVLHDRESFDSPVRFYTHATRARYRPERSAVARALTDQALAPLDFPAVIEQAWQDGVRIFLEQGPQGGCAARIRKILGNREHAAIAIDLAGVDSLRQAANATAQLIVAGVPGASAEIFERLAGQPVPTSRRVFTLPAHAEPVRPPQTRTRPRLAACQTTSTFEHHARTLAASYNGFLEHGGAGSHQAFLETSQRAYLQLVRRLPAMPVISHRFTRRDLEALASGSISEVLGPEFRALDGFRRVVRLPMPPMLLVDRVTQIEGRPLSMETGAIVTETDVRPDAWYMHRGRMAAGMMIEAGQADLLLISWLGIDLEVRGDRIYRLLGCDLTYHGGLPQAGETLRYDIRIDRHARQNEVRLFFFHYDCRVGDQLRLSVRNGQAGFFTDEELANSAGVIGTPVPPADYAQFARRHSADQLHAAAAGHAYECFGKGFEMAAAHQRSPGFAAPGMLLLDAVTHFKTFEGTAKPGYLRAELPIRPDLWFFGGHFKDDPCMPGTLMLDGCLQAMAFYMMASGLTIDHDGWRFEPVPELTYPLRCRGQVTPDSKLLVYELFVVEIANGPEPVLFADLLCTVDGLKAFHCRRMGLRLTPGHPLDDHPAPAASLARQTPVAGVNGVALDYSALLACASGSPVDAFGPPFERFVSRRLPRLPGPPYHFVTRITHIDGDFGVERSGARVVAEYDVDPDAWFFECAGSGGMPLAVLMEIALQPCGWLACYTGIPLRAVEDLYFRNLDGSATLHTAVPRARGLVRTEATLTNVARSAGITLTSFEVRCQWNGKKVLHMPTTFGFFRREDLARQAGLPPPAASGPTLSTDASIDLTTRPDRYFACPLRLPSGNLLMLDRVVWLEDPASQTGCVRAEKDLRPSEWFFKAHFYQDPVQPGSLGLEALVQALQFYVIHYGLAQGISKPAFVLDSPLAWKYRSQVLPVNQRIGMEVRLKKLDRTRNTLTIRAEGWLFVDSVRIYHFSDFGLNVVSGAE